MVNHGQFVTMKHTPLVIHGWWCAGDAKIADSRSWIRTKLNSFGLPIGGSPLVGLYCLVLFDMQQIHRYFLWLTSGQSQSSNSLTVFLLGIWEIKLLLLLLLLQSLLLLLLSYLSLKLPQNRLVFIWSVQAESSVETVETLNDPLTQSMQSSHDSKGVAQWRFFFGSCFKISCFGNGFRVLVMVSPNYSIIILREWP